MVGRRRPGREAIDRGVRLGVDVDAHDGDREADVEVVEDAVVEDERRDVGLDLHAERRRDHVALDEGLEVRAVVVDVLVRENEPHVAVRQGQAVELVEGEVAVVEAEVEPSLADRVGALGVDRAEAVGRARQHAERGVELVNEAARRGREREGRELCRDLRAELLQRQELGRLVADEVSLVAREPLGRRRQGDSLAQEIRQEIAQVEALCAQRGGGGEEKDGGEETGQTHRLPSRKSLVARLRTAGDRVKARFSTTSPGDGRQCGHAERRADDRAGPGRRDPRMRETGRSGAGDDRRGREGRQRPRRGRADGAGGARLRGGRRHRP